MTRTTFEPIVGCTMAARRISVSLVRVHDGEHARPLRASIRIADVDGVPLAIRLDRAGLARLLDGMKRAHAALEDDERGRASTNDEDDTHNDDHGRDARQEEGNDDGDSR